MLRVSVQVDTSEALRLFSGLENQLPFATALALTKTAQGVKADLTAEMSQVFANPTVFTLRSISLKRAEKQNLVAEVGIKNQEQGIGAIRYLSTEITGGLRNRGLDALLRPLGLPPSGLYSVPGLSAKMSNDKISIPWVRSLVNDIGEQGVAQARGILSRKTIGRHLKGGPTNYFVLLTKWGKLHPGIYGRRGRGVFEFIRFVKRPTYKAKFDFYGVAQRSVQAHWPSEFEAAVKRAIETAR